MRVADATDDTYDALTASGEVVVCFYSRSCIGYTNYRGRRGRRMDDIRRALTAAAWNHSRKLRVVFVQFETCRDTFHRLGIGGFGTFRILKDGVRVGEDKLGTYQGGHRDSYRLARDQLAKWLGQLLPSSE